MVGGSTDFLLNRNGWHNPDGFFVGDQSRLSQLFAERLMIARVNKTWLVRVMGERRSETVVGHIGCHY